MRKSSFQRLALSHLDLLYGVALRVTGRRDLSEDLVQETYRIAFERGHTLRDPAACRAWLLRILRNAHVDECRRSRRLVPIEGDALEVPDPRGLAERSGGVPMPSSSCPGRLEEISALVDGELAPDEELELRRHADECATCTAWRAQLEALSASVARSLGRERAPHALSERVSVFAYPRSGPSSGHGWRCRSVGVESVCVRDDAEQTMTVVASTAGAARDFRSAVRLISRP